MRDIRRPSRARRAVKSSYWWTHLKRTTRLLLAAGMLAATGCTTAPVKPASGIALLVSDRSPAFAGVQREIEKRYTQRIESFYLGVNPSEHPAVQKRIQSSDIPVVVAIGLPAAQVARGFSGKHVVFCQVFNYEDMDLTTSWMKGVAAVPPASEQFRAWKQLSPRLKKVGVITGTNLGDLMKDAQSAARENGMDLVHVEVRSDKEALYAYKQLIPKIQGLWLVPDNRVLSHEVIRDVMAHSVKEGKQVAVFSRQLLALGGLLSAESDYADIAQRVLERVKAKNTGAPVNPLTSAVIRINSVMAKRMNLPLPKTLRGLAHAP